MTTNFVTIPRTGGGHWEMVRDSATVIRYRKAGDLVWSFLTPSEVARLNAVHFGA